MNYEEFAIALIEQKIGPTALAHLVTVDRARFPDYTPEQFAAQVEGDCFHFLRRYLGFMVDVVRNVPQVKAVFDAAIANAVAAPPADLSALLGAIPNAPAALTAPAPSALKFDTTDPLDQNRAVSTAV